MTALVVWMDSRDDDDDPCRRRLVAWSDSMAVAALPGGGGACAPDMRMRAVSLWEEEEEEEKEERTAACHLRTAANVWGTCLATLAQMLVNLVEHRVTTRLRVPLGEGETILDATRLALMLQPQATRPLAPRADPRRPRPPARGRVGDGVGAHRRAAAAGGHRGRGALCLRRRTVDRLPGRPRARRASRRRRGRSRCSGAGSRAPPRRSWRSAPSGTAPASLARDPDVYANEAASLFAELPSDDVVAALGALVADPRDLRICAG